ncbi:uncharacterized protein LOC128175728 [Crassostrea angulata]|uniref:uncharacterized protein LOC128175728 n=1 Tax=Magallana angulata TaxID=2784310 RepID=UPI0022B11B4F|nr:uncharacterized protein LOC128175728 [Crassostrea angulata]
MKIREVGKTKDIAKVYEIPEGLSPGLQIIVRGRVPWETKEFAINISDKKEGGDILLHLKPRPTEGICVRNSFIGGNWGEEEKWQPDFPFTNGKSFTLKIEVTKDAFRTLVNGKMFADFKHRTDLRKGKFLVLREGAEYSAVTYQQRTLIPLTSKLPRGLKVGKTIRIRGMCSGQDGFSISFVDDKGNIYFQFHPCPQEKCVIKNACFNGNWGKEERKFVPKFPFLPMQYFEASFVLMEDKFTVFVNDEHFEDFTYRGDPENISTLNIKGRVNIQETEYLGSMLSLMEVESGLEPGDIFVLNGIVDKKGDPFAVNFLNGQSMDGDIALHLNPRAQSRDIFLNSKKAGKWQTEEKVDIPDALSSGKPFRIRVETKKKKFKIFVNGKPLTKYKVRGSIEDIKAVNVSGKVFILETLLMKRLAKPATEPLPGGIQSGSWVTLQAIPKKNWRQFVINVECGEREKKDIAFHFKVRKGDRKVFRNSCQNDKWGKEESETPCFPFDFGHISEIVFYVDKEKIMTFVNGQSFIEFKHRLPLERITHLFMDGDCNFYEPEVLV